MPLKTETGLGEETSEEILEQLFVYRKILHNAQDKAVKMGALHPETPITKQEEEMILSCKVYMDLRYCCDVMKWRRKMNYPPDWWQFREKNKEFLKSIGGY